MHFPATVSDRPWNTPNSCDFHSPSSNGKGIVEHDYDTGAQVDLDGFPPPEDLWKRYRAWRGLDDVRLPRKRMRSHSLFTRPGFSDVGR
jgi:hypothetical protein